MSNGVQIFVTMKNIIFLITLLGFIRVIFCCSPANLSEDVCTVKWFRRKRANADYTRWRFNTETTPEFIVKVLDDDMTAGTTDRLAAVNILPGTKRSEKIIVGGAMVPTTVSSSTDQMRDYTRFVPPKVSAEAEKDVLPYLVTKPGAPRDIILPIQPDQSSPNKDIVPPFFPPNAPRNAYRDESPPVSPQFLQRSHAQPMIPARQYAPIAPVAFTRRTTGTPLKPPLYARYNPDPTRSTTSGPTRTKGLLDKIKNIEDFPVLEALIEHDPTNEILLTRTTLKEVPSRTDGLTKSESFDDESDHFLTTVHASLQKFLESEFHGSEEKGFDQRRNKNPDYNNDFFYNADYKTNNKKEMDSNGKIEYDDSHEQDGVLGVSHSTEQVSTKNQININTITIEEPDSFLLVDNITADVQYPEDNLDSNEVEKTEDTKPERRVQDSVVYRDKRRPVCNMIRMRPLSFNSPRTLPEIVYQLKQWTEESAVAKWADITGGNLTTMENPIYVMIVDDPSVGQVASEKHNVLLVAGINGRDHHAVSAAMYILYQLIERSDTHHDLLSKYRFWIIPVFNPDGYDYSMTFPHRRNWMKNLRQNWEVCKGRESCQHCSSYGIRCIVSPCYGVNLDRNFEYQWIPANELQSEHPCGSLYAGTRQMSEAETQALNTYIHQQHSTISVFIAFKEGDVLGVMYPYSHTKKRRAFDQVYRNRAHRAAASALSIAGRSYVAGQTSEYLPLYAGGIEDWADGHLGIDNTYTIMMFRPTDTPRSNYLTERVIHEAYAAMDSLLLSSLTNAGRGPVIPLARSKASSLQPDFVELSLTSLASLIFSKLIFKNTFT